MSEKPTSAEERARAFEKALYDALDERINKVEEIIEKEGSLVPRIKKIDFYIIVGSMLLWSWWYSAAVSAEAGLIWYIYAILITIALVPGSIAIWRILYKPIKFEWRHHQESR